MQVRTYFCGSCAVSEIQNLGDHPDPEHAMQAFCVSQLGKKDGFISNYSKLATFYVFCAGPELPGFGHSKPWVRYGTEFAEYITNNGLGKIATLPAALNLKHHPTTTAQIWLWHPEQDVMVSFWNELQKRR